MNLLNKLSNWYFKKAALPYWGILMLDCAAVMAAGYYAFYLEVGGGEFASRFWQVTRGLLLGLVVFVIAFRVFHTYAGVIRYSSFVDLRNVALAAFSACLLCAGASYLLDLVAPASWRGSVELLSIGGYVILFIAATLMMWFLRIIVKGMYDNFRVNTSASRAFIYGVRDGAVALAKGLQNQENRQFVLAGFISPDGYLAGQYLMGARVYEDRPGLIAQMREEHASALLVSPLQTDHFREQDALINAAIDAGIRILMIPQPREWDAGASSFAADSADANVPSGSAAADNGNAASASSGKTSSSNALSNHAIVASASVSNLREVDIEDLLPREQIRVDMGVIGATLRGKSILITGAAGSIGSEIVRQVAAFRPSQLILVDQAETPMHDIRLMMERDFPRVPAQTIVASITCAPFMERIFAQYRPEYVFHAAAYKHVPMMEDNPAMAVQNNIRGTRVIADLAVKYGTLKFVMISTDKAVNPTNVMGCSKRICEIYCQSLNKAISEGKVKGVTQFVTTRFGNVLGSNGSVIPLFREQIKNGGPVTVTHPDIIRYFMLIPEACKLVLEAATLGHGGEIFVFDMGKPVRIADLARRMIALSGATGVQIKFTGLRDGEKLYEEVLADTEKTVPTPNKKIFVASVREYDYADACRSEDRLMDIAATGSALEIVRCMQETVPEYHSTNLSYK